MIKKYIYFFGGGRAEGNESMKNLLGGKGANLAEMAGRKDLQLPVPPGFTISTEVCTYFYSNRNSYPKGLRKDTEKSIKKIEGLMERKFGDINNPLLVSVRSGARRSMPGMMETILNVGLTTKTIPGLIKQSGNERFAYDSYRRLITMYSDVVMEKAGGIEPEENSGIRKQLEKIMDKIKENRGVTNDTDLNKKLDEEFKNLL